MRKLEIIIALFIGCFLNCNGQQISKSLKNDIVNLYINNNEVQERDGQNILNDFKGLATIKDLKDGSICYLNKAGLYKVSINFTHTTSHVIMCDDKKKCTLLPVFTDYYDSLQKILLFLKAHEEIDRTETLEYIESFFKLVKENIEINKLDEIGLKKN